ncbi:MAG TPA: MobF family relaxase [Acidimicrobiales bacterium]|nr:MobF family relaxase [Acidimicrobiales bacterium]
MLSRGKVTPGSVRYYTNEVAGLSDYYAGKGEAPGRWVGRGSAATGLAGEVSPEQLASLFEGAHPVTGETLGVGYRVRPGADRVTGWDLTFSAPKSVSALWGVGGGEVGMAVRSAHDAAVQAALDYLEEHAAFSRQGKAGIRQVDTEGLVAAAFVHRSSRAGDPQLHTHVLVSGRVRCGDGEWRALDSRALHRELKTAGMVYQAALRAELSARLGLRWSEVDRHGQAEVAGVPERLCRHYSARRKRIEERAAQRMAESEVILGRALTPEERRRAYERATLGTRTAKVHDDVAHEGLHDRWRVEAATAEFDPDDWVGAVVARPARPQELEVEPIVAEALAELSLRASTWGRTDVVRQVVRRMPPTTGSAEDVRTVVEDLADAVLGERGVVRLAAPSARPPAELRRRDGRSVFEPHGAARYSTQQTLAREQHVLDAAHAGRDAGRAVASKPAVEVAIAEGGLGDDQASAVRRVTLDGDAVSCVVGPAGTGKSRTMGTAARAWANSGMTVRGLAVSAAAAGVLQTEAGIASDTVAKFLLEHDGLGGATGPYRLGRDDVVVVDEAGMLASADLARVVALAEQAEAKVVLVGDHAQLGAVEAGGLFRLLAGEGAVELNGVRRFDQEWERAASLQLRDRNPNVVAMYEEQGRIVGGDRAVMVAEALDRWSYARAAGESVVVCAADHATVDAIAARARAARVAAGEVEPDGVSAGTAVVGVGDEIVTTRNDRRLATTRGGWVRNGDRWRVLSRRADNSLVVDDLAGRGRTLLPGEYVAEEVALAYAVTIHKAQGLTVDRAVLLVDEHTTAEGLYVGMTRGRRSNVALAVTDELDLDHPPVGRTCSASEVVAGAMSRTASEQAALQVLREALSASESLATLAPRLANVNAWIRQEMPPDCSAELNRVTAERDALRQHARPGHLTRAGRDHRRRLDAVEARWHGLQADQQKRNEWLAAHADTLAHREELAAAVAQRGQELGAMAAAPLPAHVVDLIGTKPTDPDAGCRWTQFAGRIEAYREEWAVEPGQLRERPRDHVQAPEWDVSIHAVRTLARQLSSTPGRSVEVGVEVDL